MNSYTDKKKRDRERFKNFFKILLTKCFMIIYFINNFYLLDKILYTQKNIKIYR